MSKLETRVDQLDPGFRIGSKGELDGIGKGVLESIHRFSGHASLESLEEYVELDELRHNHPLKDVL